MHILQPKYSKLKQEEVDKIRNSLNISLKQLPKIKLSDPSLPENVNIGDVIKIERVENSNKNEYYRIVIPS